LAAQPLNLNYHPSTTATTVIRLAKLALARRKIAPLANQLTYLNTDAYQIVLRLIFHQVMFAHLVNQTV